MRNFCSILALFFFFASSLPALADLKQDKLSIQTTAGKPVNFTVEIADDPQNREAGLQHRTSMAEDHGMLFIFDEDNYVEMWMKDTPISLDMLFIDSHGKIITIAAKTTPESTDVISAKKVSRAVLELAAGVTEKRGIKVGDQVNYPYFKP